jgi:CheY-like chemotaxis protein
MTNGITSRKRILLVDDDEIHLTTTKVLLQNEYDIFIAKSGKEALEFLEKSEYIPDLILLDIIMPVMDGWDVFTMIRETGRLKDIPIAFLTSENDESARKKALALDAAKYITKPYDVLKLKNIIKEIVNKIKTIDNVKGDQKLIFIIDDNRVNLLIGLNALSKKYMVTIALSAIKMFFILEKIKPDLILLDIDMPEMNGYEAIIALKSKPETKDIPVIFLSARTELEDVQKSLSLGAINYVTKPYEPQYLLELIDKHFSNYL